MSAMVAILAGIEYYLPSATLTNGDLAAEFPEWTIDKIAAKTGIRTRHIASADECVSDLAVAAAARLFQQTGCAPAAIDFLLLCTQTPDYFLPTTACILQERLGIPRSAGALDFSLGCSGFVYGLGLSKALIETEQAANVLLITGDTYSKLIHPGDKSVRTLFGDAAAATLVRHQDETNEAGIGPLVYGTDGRGAANLMVPNGGMRRRIHGPAPVQTDSQGNMRSADNLYMNGAELFAFAISTVPIAVADLLHKARLTLEEIDLFVFHQANGFMLERLRQKLHIPAEKFWLALEHVGNTVSSSIPIALKEAQSAGRLNPGDRVMVVGFGVGYSWSAALVRWASKGSPGS